MFNHTTEITTDLVPVPTVPTPPARVSKRERALTEGRAEGGRRAPKPYRHSRPVFDRQVRVHSEYVRRLVSDRQLKPAMTALYGIDLILRLIATEAEIDRIDQAIDARLLAISEALGEELEVLRAQLALHHLTGVRPRYTAEQELRIEVSSPPIGTYTNLIVELDQLMIAIDTLWLSGLMSNQRHVECLTQWRDRLGLVGQAFVALHRAAYDEADRRGQREAVDRAEPHPVLTVIGEDGEDVDTLAE